jgi:hypothetical protein
MEDQPPRDLAQSTPQLIAAHGVVCVSRYHDSQSRMADRGRPREQIEVIGSTALPL